PRIAVDEPLSHLGRAIGRTVIDDDHLKVGERLGLHRLKSLREIAFGVVGGHDDADGWRDFHHGLHSISHKPKNTRSKRVIGVDRIWPSKGCARLLSTIPNNTSSKTRPSGIIRYRLTSRFPNKQPTRWRGVTLALRAILVASRTVIAERHDSDRTRRQRRRPRGLVP